MLREPLDPREPFNEMDPDKYCPECGEPLYLFAGEYLERNPKTDTLEHHVCSTTD